ncbi:hypothetical protein [Brachyspira hyodysenteriae]|uniref:hypothetical protein n=1 Tax=Brachyspira hyodysenteriae TaxID=159 RepID=UPI00063D98EA|nr:hypothetical protein [Brachyspira hyodysenteriae]KLI20376.1 hypothetical protein SU43_12805 [Brachyspira hyodysenteriae]KLI23306.1 hypothetical protein SR30_10320 [Brachyspira hyodysenteriae]KLI38384.1 hypothetical protein SZ52_12545 [Brachyspira hyodysenteriae]KLI40515.1 hypothetical protein SZ51_00400 [Brachyspira hyodysenteriae]KLI42236.1 hypothetical protein SZ53_06470 [Brachyspira hyodysenteriae]
MENFNLNDIEQIMTFYLIFNFVILACIIYIIISLIFRLLPKKQEEDNKDNKKNKSLKKKKKKKKDIIDLFWTEDKDSKTRTTIKRSVFIIFIAFTLYYIFNSITFIIANIDVVKKVLKIE